MIMATNKKPRKAYRPKAVGYQLTRQLRDDMELSTRIHLNRLWNGTLDVGGWNSLTAYFNICYAAISKTRFDAALTAMESIRDRHGRTGVYGATGDERNTVMEQYNESIEQLRMLSDDTIARAVNYVWSKC